VLRDPAGDARARRDEIDIESEPQLLQDVERTGGDAAMRRVRKGLREEQQSRSGGQGR